jgi:amino acid transporter
MCTRAVTIGSDGTHCIDALLPSFATRHVFVISVIERAGRAPKAAVRATTTLTAALALVVPHAAHASFLSGETLDSAANVVSWVVLILVPIIAIAVFWIVHVMPEKIAHKRHHPQTAAIQVLCLLSLVFGGLLWPLAWIWAYTRPIGYKLAYGTDKHDDYFVALGEKARSGDALAHEVDALRLELDTMHARGALPPHLARLREDLVAMPVAPEQPAVTSSTATAESMPELERRSA